MAELVFKIDTVGPDPAYQDGDCICAFNDERIQTVHLRHICNVRKFGFNSNGDRPISLAKTYLENTCKYLFQRISRTEVRRTEIVTGNQVVIDHVSKLIDGQLQHIHVAEYLRRQKRNPNHVIFSNRAGKEYWYAGTVTPRLNIMWDEIELQTPERRRDPKYKVFPASNRELAAYLFVSVDDFTFSREGVLVSSVLNEKEEILLKMRRIKSDWRLKILDQIAETEANILDKTKKIDKRSHCRCVGSPLRDKVLDIDIGVV